MQTLIHDVQIEKDTIINMSRKFNRSSTNYFHHHCLKSTKLKLFKVEKFNARKLYHHIVTVFELLYL